MMTERINVSLHPTIHLAQAKRLADRLGVRLVTRGWKVVLAGPVKSKEVRHGR